MFSRNQRPAKNYYSSNVGMKNVMSSIFTTSDYLSSPTQYKFQSPPQSQHTNYFTPHNYHLQHVSSGSIPDSVIRDFNNSMQNINENYNKQQIWNNESAWNNTKTINNIQPRQNVARQNVAPRNMFSVPRRVPQQSRISLGNIINSRNVGCGACGR